jgi:glycosyltransferase involved in cell wall biosynthesis
MQPVDLQKNSTELEIAEVALPLVSIIITNYNYGSFLKRAIDSALNQTYSHIEIVVVDDGSTDNSHEIIRSFDDRLIPIFKENGGQASAFNAGFLNSRGEIICFLDADDQFTSEKIEEIVNIFRTHQEIGWCFNALKQINSSTDETLAIMAPHGSSSVMDWRKSMIEQGERPPFAPATSALSFRRETLAKILPMPEVEGILLSDNYIKFAAVSLKQGFYLNRPLSIMSIHGNNLYTNRKNLILIAKLDLVTAYWLKKKFPDLKRFTNRLFRTGLANYWRCHQVNKNVLVIIKDYFEITSLLEKTKILLVASFHYTRATGKFQ